MTTAPASPPRTYTAEEFLKLPMAKLYELLDGELVRRSMSKRSAGVITAIIGLFYAYVTAGRLGFLFDSSIGMRIFPDRPDHVPRPDMAYVRRERLPGGYGSGGYLEIVPDFIVEVVSRGDNALALGQKLLEYRQVGVPLIWIVYPELRTVHVIRENGPEVTFAVGQRLDAEPAVPGFSCAVAEIFAE